MSAEFGFNSFILVLTQIGQELNQSLADQKPVSSRKVVAQPILPQLCGWKVVAK
jgi:hypothetical protein